MSTDAVKYLFRTLINEILEIKLWYVEINSNYHLPNLNPYPTLHRNIVKVARNDAHNNNDTAPPPESRRDIPELAGCAFMAHGMQIAKRDAERPSAPRNV